MCDCALLFGIPIQKEEYLLRLAESDYLRTYRGKPEENWNESYDKFIAKPFRDLARQAQEMINVEVRTGATLTDLEAVSKTARVIVLVSHWKNYGFPNDDFVKPTDEIKFAEAAAQATEPLARWLTQTFERHGMGRDRAKSRSLFNWFDSIKALWEPDKTIREILEQALDATIQNDLPLIEGVSEYVESELKRRSRRRDLMDNLFSNLILPGNRLELFDGLHDCTTISRSIHGEFRGVLDLTTCTSTILADHVSADHQYRFRVVQFSKNQEPIWATAVLNAALTLMSKGYGYLDARQRSLQLAREAAQIKIRAKR